MLLGHEVWVLTAVGWECLLVDLAEVVLLALEHVVGCVDEGWVGFEYLSVVVLGGLICAILL